MSIGYVWGLEGSRSYHAIVPRRVGVTEVEAMVGAQQEDAKLSYGYARVDADFNG